MEASDMNNPTNSPVLAKLADIFRQEGDTVTADALDRQLQSTTTRELTDEQTDRIEDLRRRGNRLDSQGRHDHAELLLAEVLRIAEGALGPEHEDIARHLNDLARCRFNNGDFEAALEDYSRLLRIAERDYAPDDERVSATAYQVRRCHQELRLAIGSMRFQGQVDRMLQHARDMRSIDKASVQERTREVAHRLLARGRVAASTCLYERWITLRLEGARPDDAIALLDIRDYAMALRSAGECRRAASVLQKILAIRNRTSCRIDDSAELLRALSDWQACLAELGATRSAAETAALADSIANKAGKAPQPKDGP
jgi:tetratricopeptide (TPR) repeat protein